MYMLRQKIEPATLGYPEDIITNRATQPSPLWAIVFWQMCKTINRTTNGTGKSWSAYAKELNWTPKSDNIQNLIENGSVT